MRLHLLHPREHTPDEASVVFLKLHELRKTRPYAHGLRVSGVNSRHERLGYLVQGLASETPPHEVSEAFIGFFFSPGNKKLKRHPNLSGNGDKTACRERKYAGRHHEDYAFGKEAEFPLMIHEGLAARLSRREEARLKAQSFYEFHCPRLFRKKTIRPALHEETVYVFGLYIASEARGLFDYAYTQGFFALQARVLDEAIGGREAGYSAAYYDHPFQCAPPCLFITSASMEINFPESFREAALKNPSPASMAVFLKSISMS